LGGEASLALVDLDLFIRIWTDSFNNLLRVLK